MFNIHQDRPLVNPFSYSPGIIQALETALSAERLTAYLRVTSGDRERALRLYLWNTEISAAFYGPLQGVEVALRNALHRELSRVFGTSWYDAPAMPLAARAQDLIREAKAAIAHSRKPVIPPRVVAALSFGFWVSLLGPGLRRLKPSLRGQYFLPGILARRPPISIDFISYNGSFPGPSRRRVNASSPKNRRHSPQSCNDP